MPRSMDTITPILHIVRLVFMQISDIFLGLGEPAVAELLRTMSLGKLKTYQLFDRLKARLHVHKLNSEMLRKVAPRVWERLNEHDEEFATELSQAILISHLDMIQAVLDFLGSRTRRASSRRISTARST